MAKPVSLNLVSKNKNNKKISRKIAFVNPNAPDEDLITFAAALAGLSENTLEKIQKMQPRDLSEYRIIGTSEDDWLEVGDDCTVISGAGNDTLVFGADISATVNDFSLDDCISLLSNISEASFEDGLLTLGNIKITLEDVKDISPYYDMIVYNGEDKTTLGELLNPYVDVDIDEYLDAIFAREISQNTNADVTEYLDRIFAGTTQSTNPEVEGYIGVPFEINPYLDGIFGGDIQSTDSDTSLYLDDIFAGTVQTTDSEVANFIAVPFEVDNYFDNIFSGNIQTTDAEISAYLDAIFAGTTQTNSDGFSDFLDDIFIA